MNLSLLKSRKFWATLTALALVILRAYAPNFPLTDDTLLAAVLALASYIFGVAIEDAGKARSK